MKQFYKLAIILAAFLFSSPVLAGGGQITESEKQFLSEFDAAVKTSDALNALSKLSLMGGSKIVNPQILGMLKSCMLNYTGIDHGTLVAGWNSTPESPCRSKLGVGYYATIKMKDERIKIFILGKTEIIPTSGDVAI